MINYKSAGVDITAGNEAVKRIKKNVESTFSPQVLSGLGGFGSLYDLSFIQKNYQHPVLVQSIDGVGTKIIIARMMECYDTIGMDLVSATTNDIVVLGATPLTLLDYIANDKLRPEVVAAIVAGMASACRENGISLVGGETAEMPGTYLAGEHDLVGVITGIVEKNKIIDGRDIVPGDVVLAFASSGLHTNGYSLARKLFFDQADYSVETHLSEYSRTLGEILLEPHLNYTRPVHALLDYGIPIKGMAHITGGGLLENIPRILPKQCAVEIKKDTWPEQPIFSLMQTLGQLNDFEMHRTFNMGVGFILIVSPDQITKAHEALTHLSQFTLYEIGEVVSGNQTVQVVTT
ncbi:MAG: phosphoribosylformylglycinamidine cyclo-ligase [Gammaproteobacteria bacterium]|nr:phosphoribosylformylglycinamidine cyclo-ligase [Gammaproteobacteria bacterium]